MSQLVTTIFLLRTSPVSRLGELAYRPFLDPILINGYWYWFLPPLALAIAVVYKTLRVPNLNRLPGEALVLAAQIIAFMVGAAATLWVLTSVF